MDDTKIDICILNKLSQVLKTKYKYDEVRIAFRKYLSKCKNYNLNKSIAIGSAAAAIVVTKVGCAPAMQNLNAILEFMKYNKISLGD